MPSDAVVSTDLYLAARRRSKSSGFPPTSKAAWSIFRPDTISQFGLVTFPDFLL
jgi:hypothetical protein